MNEISIFETYKKKLQGICEENNLVYRFRYDTYPITLTIRPCGGVGEQLSMLECMGDRNYTSPDAAIIFMFADGTITYNTSKTFTIGDALFTKIKNLFKNMHYSWLQYFFRSVIESQALRPGTMPVIDESNVSDEKPEESETGDEAPEETYDVSEDGDVIILDDASIADAIKIVRMENKATVSLLQRRMSIGYSAASRIMDKLEEMGVVGPYKGSEPREVLPADLPDDAEE